MVIHRMEAALRSGLDEAAAASHHSAGMSFGDAAAAAVVAAAAAVAANVGAVAAGTGLGEAAVETSMGARADAKDEDHTAAHKEAARRTAGLQIAFAEGASHTECN
jgi:hypothetical protein